MANNKAQYSSELKISGQFIFEPSKESITIATIQSEDSGRDNNNELFVNVIDGNQQSVSLQWQGLNKAQKAELLQLLRKGVFTFTYEEPVYNNIVTRHFMAGNRSCEIYNKALDLYDISVEVVDCRWESDGDRTEPSFDV